MGMLGSILFGCEGEYEILGGKVQFGKYDDDTTSPVGTKSLPLQIISNTARAIARNQVFKVVTFGYLHVFMHTIGHALAYKILTGSPLDIEIDTDSCGSLVDEDFKLPPIKQFITSLSGPLLNMTLCSIQLVAATALCHYVGLPIAGVIAGGSIMWICAEFAFAGCSMIKQEGDFANISRMGILPFITSIAMLVGTSALGVFASYKQLKTL